jgi:serine/threonine protein kinase
MYQTHQTAKSTRKPDIVILPLKSACAPFEDEKGGKKGKQKDNEKDIAIDNKDNARDGEKDDEKRKKKRKAHMDTNATAKPKNLLWKDVLASIEFKRKTPGRTKGIRPPPPSYTVTDYFPTKPEYLPVDHLKAQDPALDPSQIPATQPASDTTFLSSGLSAVQPSHGGSSSKRKATDTLESAAKKSKMDPNDTDDDLDVTVQAGLYAAEMFASNPGVNYLVNLIIIDDIMWIWYYDRQGIIQCSGINFIQDLPRFMVLLYALQRFDLHDWGRNKDFLPVQVEGKRCHEFKIKDQELGEVDLLLHTSHDKRVTHYGLQGRATNVVPVTSEALTKKYGNFQDGMVAKIFWGEASRTSEPEILDKVEEIAKVHPTVQGHIPKLLWHHTFTNPTSAIREALGVPEPTKGSRVLYILIFPKLHPITELDDRELFDVWRQCILCHITLWKEGVYHRDVSPGNLMWYWKDGKRMGVLNDYDLSSLANVQGPQGNERTGTVPFMARELLTEEGQRGKVKHLYRHDLESFMWVFVWICLRYKQGVLLPRRLRRFDEWATLGPIACGEKKLVFLNNMTAFPPSDINEDVWDFLVDCFVVLKRDADNRYYLRLKRPSSSGECQQPDDDSNFDAFLSKFTSLEGWVELSKPSK